MVQADGVKYNRFADLARRHPDALMLIIAETERQRNHFIGIPSENFASEDVMTALGTSLVNKYAEGYPGGRYYDGNDVAADPIELRTIQAVKTAFQGYHANVQPLAGAIANLAYYFSILNPRDTILSPSLAHGGHLSHGHNVNMVSKIFNVVQYGVRRDNERIDVDQFRDLAKQHKPRLVIVGGSAYPFTPPYTELAEITDEIAREYRIRTYKMADIAHPAGLVAGGQHPNPLNNGYDSITFTDQKTLRGPRAANIVLGRTASEEIEYMGNKITLANAVDKAVFPGLQGGPHMHTIFAKLIALEEMLTPDLSRVNDDYIAHQKQTVVNARALAENFLSLDYRLVGGGTDTHLLLIAEPRGFPGRVAQEVARRIGISTNKNSIPYDKRKPFNPSGLRIGTPAMTTRGAKPDDMATVASSLDDALKHTTVNEREIIVPESVIQRNRERISEVLSSMPPLYDRFYTEMREAAMEAGLIKS